MGENDTGLSFEDPSTPIPGSPARPSSKQFKRSAGSTPKRGGRSLPSGTDSNASSSWMMSSSQLANITQSLQKFLDSRQNETLTAPTTISLFRDETSDSLAPPSLYFQHISPQNHEQSSSNNPNNSTLALASSYLQLWFTLLETQWTDPHPLVSKAAKHILGAVKIDIIAPALQSDMSDIDGRKSDIILEKPDFREIHSGRPQSHDLIRSHPSTPPLQPKTPDIDGGKSPVKRMNDPFSSFSLTSTTYEWNRYPVSLIRVTKTI